MLHDHACRCFTKRLNTLQRGIGVRHIVVGKFLALDLPGCGHRGLTLIMLHKKSGALMGVLAVTHCLDLAELEIDGTWKIGTLTRSVDCPEIIRNRTIIACRMLKRFHSQRITGGICYRAIVLLHFFQHQGIVGAVDHHGDIRVVLGCGAQHRRAANIDILDGHRQVTVFPCNRLLKRIKIDHDQVNRGDPVFGHDRIVDSAPPENTAVDLRMQCFDTPVHHFRETGVIRHLRHRHGCICQQPGCPAGRQDLNTQLMQGAGKFLDTGLVGDTDQGLFDLVHK